MVHPPQESSEEAAEKLEASETVEHTHSCAAVVLVSSEAPCSDSPCSDSEHVLKRFQRCCAGISGKKLESPSVPATAAAAAAAATVAGVAVAMIDEGKAKRSNLF